MVFKFFKIIVKFDLGAYEPDLNNLPSGPQFGPHCFFNILSIIQPLPKRIYFINAKGIFFLIYLSILKNSSLLE